MNLLTLLLLIMAVAGPVLAWWILFVQLPDLNRTCRRLDLQDIRDGLLEAICTDRLQPTAPVIELLDSIETLIRR
jgi:hypothetical protein